MNAKSKLTTAKKEMRRWGNGMRAAPDFAREQILNAALDCFQKQGLNETGMAEIAREAKVTRATIYRHFQNRNDVVLGVILRELNEVLNSIQDHLPQESSFAEFIVETLSVADEKIRSSPIFELIVSESAMLLQRVHEYGIDLLTFSALHFRARFDAANAAGELQPGLDYSEFVKWLYHVGASFILIPSTALTHPNLQKSSEMRQMLWRYLIPAIVRAEALPPAQTDSRS